MDFYGALLSEGGWIELEFVLLGGNGVERLGKALSKNGKKVKTVAMGDIEYRFQ
jgi:hypothetical protein